MMSLIDDLRKGSRLALSRVLTQVENASPAGQAALDELFPYTGKAHKIGITGPPGSGKSTLVNTIARELRISEPTARVAIIAVDPTSPFTGGAILGDRVRMQALQNNPMVFIRSMASRGALGGLATSTQALSQVFDAAGYEYILIETVGAGQSEVDIVNLAHTTIVVDIPGLGDDIQSIKAGILEIADILVVNKADHPGADQSARYLRSMIEMGHGPSSSQYGKHTLREWKEVQKTKPETEAAYNWLPPVVKTIATDGTGIAELVNQINSHRAWLKETGNWEDKDAFILREVVRKMVIASLVQKFETDVPPEEIERILIEVIKRIVSPSKATEELLAYNRNSNNSQLSE